MLREIQYKQNISSASQIGQLNANNIINKETEL